MFIVQYFKTICQSWKNFGPYGLPKSALLSLCKQCWLWSIGIRSNGVNADRIKSGLMTGKMIKTRASQICKCGDIHERKFIVNEVKAEDVAKAFFSCGFKKRLELCLQLMVVTLLLL